MDPYLVAELKTYIFTVAAGSGVVAGALTAWLGHLASARILRNEDTHQRLKTDLYRRAVEPYIRMFIETKFTGGASMDRIKEFESARLSIASELTLFAPQPVMDAFNNMADYLFEQLERNLLPDEPRVIQLGTAFLNAARKDIGLGKGTVRYTGSRLSAA